MFGHFFRPSLAFPASSDPSSGDRRNIDPPTSVPLLATTTFTAGRTDGSPIDVAPPVWGQRPQPGETSMTIRFLAPAALWAFAFTGCAVASDASDTPSTDETEHGPGLVDNGPAQGADESAGKPDGGANDDAADDGADDGTVDEGDAAPAEFPSDLLDLTNWKLTLPTGEAESPTEVEQPALDEFEVDPWFQVNPEGDGVAFRANAGGVTTSGSGYPRSELREMTADGTARADWSTTEGVHSMTITQAITALTEVKPHAVAGQIHDAADDVVMIRLEGTKLYVEGGGEDLGLLDANYQLGTEFTVNFTAHDGVIDVYYEDMATPVVTIPRATTGCYFKAGVYTQSNPERGDAPEDFAEVEIYDLVVTHQ